MSTLSTIIGGAKSTIITAGTSRAQNSVINAVNGIKVNTGSGLLGTVLGNAVGALKQSAINYGTTAIQGIGNGVADILRGPSNAPTESGSDTVGDALKGIQSRGDALQNWSWFCLPPTIEIGGASISLPWYYVPATTLPFRNIQVESVNMNGHPVHFPESYSVPELEIQFFLDSKNLVQNWLKAWQGKILGNATAADGRNQGMWGLPAEYKKTFNIVLLDTGRKQMLNVKYYNCWPTTPNALELNSEAATALSHSVTFHVEDMDITVLNDQGVIDQVFSSGLSGFNLKNLAGSTQDQALNLITSSLQGQIFNAVNRI